MPTIDVTDAPQRLLVNKSVTPGHCLEYNSRAIRNGLPPLIWQGLDTALDCWNLACGDKHTGRDVPLGFPAFLGAKSGNADGDVILSRGDGTFVATDYPGWGQVGICTLAEREAQTGRKYVGYAGQFLGYTLTSTTTASLDATPLQEDDMQEADWHRLDIGLQSVIDQIRGDKAATINQVRQDLGYLRDTTFKSLQASVSSLVSADGKVDVAPILTAINALPAQTATAVKAALKAAL